MLTQNELSELLGISRVHLSNLKRGTANAGIDIAKRLAKRTGTTPELWLMGGRTKARAAAIGKTLKGNR